MQDPPLVQPAETFDYDVAVIGAGVVGLAVAQAVAQTGRSVVVLERHAAPGTETSSRNSQVIHAGLYYARGSLKARLCVDGARRLYGWCERHGVPHARVGKFIVATSPEEEQALDALRDRAADNGVTLERVSRGALASEEPNVRATAALFSPNTGIVDAHALVASLASEARAHGADLALVHEVIALSPRGAGYEVRCSGPDQEPVGFVARAVVNAAGLDADTVASLAGIDVDAAGYRLVYVKGSYFRLRPRGLVRHLVYPVPNAGLTGLGVHATVELDGAVRLGPDVEELPDRRLDYTVSEARAGDFFSAASRYLTGLALEDVAPDQAGIRPRLARASGPVRDFVIAEESARGLSGLVSLVGIESPGLTAALSIAAEVVSLLS